MAGWGQAMAGAGASSATDWHAFAASRMINRGAARKAYKRQLEYTEWLNKHRHQWEVEDLRKAGLNPVLSAIGGGAAASGSAPMAQAPINKISGSSALQSALEMRRNLAEVKIMENQADKIGEDAKTSEAAAAIAELDARVASARQEARLHQAGVERSWWWRNVVTPAGKFIKQMSPFTSSARATQVETFKGGKK